MAETRIADVIVPEVFVPYVKKRTTELSALWASGLVQTDDRIVMGMRNGGETINMPYWNDLDGEAEELSDQKDLTVNNITSGADVAVVQALGKAFGRRDLAALLAGEDPAGAIGDAVAGFWARNMQYRVISLLAGTFASASMAAVNNFFDISGLSAGAAVIDGSNFVDARWRLGDQSEQLSAVAMHSSVKSKLEKDDLIETVKSSSGLTFETYQGKRVIVDDGCPVANGVYTTYLFGPGAIGHADGVPAAVDMPEVETDRNSLGGYNVLISRRVMVLHLRGVKWIGTATISTGDNSGGHPTRAELATGTNWQRVYNAKEIRVVAFKHRIATA